MKINKVVIAGHSGHYNYALPYLKNNDINVSGIYCDPEEDVSRLKLNLEKQGFAPKIYYDYEMMLREEMPDVAVINSIFNRNTDMAISAVENKINVFLEKPAAINFMKFEELRKICLDNPHIKLGGMFGLRYDSPFQTVKHLIDTGELGIIRMMNSQKSYKMGIRPDFYKNRDTYGGIFTWVGIHAIDWMTWLTGEKYLAVQSMQSNKFNNSNGDMEVTGLAIYSMTNDVMASLNVDMIRPQTAPTHDDDRLRIIGTKSVAEIIGGKVYLNGAEIELLPAKDIFDEFVNTDDVNAENLLYSTEIALLTRDSADIRKKVSMPIK